MVLSNLSEDVNLCDKVVHKFQIVLVNIKWYNDNHFSEKENKWIIYVKFS